MSHRLTLLCDSCGKEYMVDETMDMPPYWMAVQIAIGDKEGFVPEHERDKFIHFCSQECFADYCGSAELKERIMLVDRMEGADEEEPDDD
jgi:hypothetical protein